MNKFPTVVSYYTKGTGYEEEVKNLIESCERFSMPYEIDAIDSLGSWEKNCCFKPQFLLEKLKKLQSPILWLDADSVVNKKPILFEGIDCDIAVRIFDELPSDHPSKVISGTVFVNASEKAATLLEDWAKECKAMLQSGAEEVWDQEAMRNVVFRSDAHVMGLEEPYCMVYDKIKNKAMRDEAVILHYQASRLFRKEVNRLVVPFWEAEMAQQKNRTTFYE